MVDKNNNLLQISKNTKDDTSSYRSIFKATSLFGGVQLYQIIIELIRSKFIAVLLGPLGVGIQGLYTSATQLIQHLTSFGLSTSAVRNVAEAYNSNDKHRVATVIFSLRRLAWLTGLLGMAIVIIFSPILSITSFGDNNHIIPFIFISVTLLFTQLNAGQLVVLQGTRNLKLLAKASAIGVTLGLLTTIPLYYWLGIRGIVINIIIISISTLTITWLYAKRIEIEKVSLTYKEIFRIGKSMLIMGIAMSISHIFSFASSYALRAYIRLWDGVETVGLFSAGYILMNQYTGLVFKAMGTDFYPRLASVNQDNAKCRQTMNQQGEIGILILSPLLVICVLFIPFAVRLLYSEAFLPINTYILWCSLGMLFKMASWSISYIYVAKGESILFMIIETSAAVYTFAFNLLGYKLGSLSGLGISFTISYIIYLIQVFVIAKIKYKFSFSPTFIKIFVVHFFILSACIICILFKLSTFWEYFIGIAFIAISSLYSYKELNKRINFHSILQKRHKKI